MEQVEVLNRALGTTFIEKLEEQQEAVKATKKGQEQRVEKLEKRHAPKAKGGKYFKKVV